MSNTSGTDPLPGDVSIKQDGAVFGYEEFWPKVYAQFKRQFEDVVDLMRLGDEMMKNAEESADGSVKNVICTLTRATMTGACEAILLCGNGCGAGAMKIVRGMYESRWMAEYLRLHPEEVEDYLDFKKIILWRRLHWLQEYSGASCVTPNVISKVDDDFNQVKDRFMYGKGKVRHRWSKNSIEAMAKEIGQEKQYDLPYAIACSIHHSNFEGLSALFTSDNGDAMPDPPPSGAWVEKALLAAHTNLLFALGTLNESCDLDFRQRLDAMQQAFSRTWKEQRPDSEEMNEKLRGGAE
jgi:hypothetical protein